MLALNILAVRFGEAEIASRFFQSMTAHIASNRIEAFYRVQRIDDLAPDQTIAREVLGILTDLQYIIELAPVAFVSAHRQTDAMLSGARDHKANIEVEDIM